MNKYICMAKEGVDFRNYGFKLEREGYVYYINTKRITIRKDLSMRFNQVTVDVLMVFSKLVQDKVVYFVKNDALRNKQIKVNKKEYDLIMSMRNSENKEN